MNAELATENNKFIVIIWWGQVAIEPPTSTLTMLRFLCWAITQNLDMILWEIGFGVKELKKVVSQKQYLLVTVYFFGVSLKLTTY